MGEYDKALEELGKFFLDLGKIVVGLGLLLPLVKGELRDHLSIITLLSILVLALMLVLIGFILIRRSRKNGR